MTFESLAICLRNENYVGHYDRYNNYKIIKRFEHCKGQWPVECDKEACSSSQESCRLFTHLKRFSSPIGYGQFLKEKFKAYSSFKENLKNCQDTFSLDLNDVCLNGQKCYRKTSVSINFGLNLKLVKPTNCQSKDELSYKCGKNL